MRLRGVYETHTSKQVLFDLLAEREPEESISHKSMPTWDDHVAFVASRPYQAWYIIEDDNETPVGACYLTSRNEIGIGIFRAHRGKGYAKAAISELMRLHQRQEYLANVSPHNLVSLSLFKALGFAGPIQVTLRHAGGHLA